MANSSNHTLSAEVLARWERLYNILGRGYAYISKNSTVEAEILGLFRTVDATSVEGTQLGKEYRNFSTLFINFLAAYNRAYETVLVTAVVKARYQDRHERLETVWPRLRRSAIASSLGSRSLIPRALGAPRASTVWRVS